MSMESYDQPSKETYIDRLPTPSTKEESNFLRYYLLIDNIGAQAVRCKFDKEFPPAKLGDIIKRNMGVLYKLKKLKHLNIEQWKRILPYGSTATSSMFDVSLMIMFFRNMSSVAPEGFNYDNLPEPADTRLCADLARIKYYRNAISHDGDKNDKKLDNKTFRDLWETVSKAIIRIAGKEYEQKCSDLFDRPLDPDYLRPSERDKIDSTLNCWRIEDRCFVETEASKNISRIMKTANFVIVTGSPGSGKSFTAQHILISMKDEGYDVIPVATSSEIVKFISKNIRQVFFIDNFCGKYNILHTEIETWEKNEETIQEIILKNNIVYNENLSCDKNEKTVMQHIKVPSLTKIIFTCRLQILKDPLFKNLHLESCNVCDLSSHYRLSPSEKISIGKQYLSDDVIKSLSNDVIEKSECFPLLCKLFTSKKTENPLYFRHPKEYFQKELDELRIKPEKIKYACIAFCVIYNDIVPFEIFLSDLNERTKRIFKTVLERCGICFSTPRKKIKTQFDAMVGSFFSKTDTGYTSIHDYMFDIYCDHFCSTPLLQCIVENAHSELMHDRALLLSIGHKGVYGDIVIPVHLESTFFHRIRRDIMEDKIQDVFAASQMKHKKYRLKLLKMLENVELNRQDRYGYTPLLVSSLTGYNEVVDALIKKGGEVNMCTACGKSPLYLASQQGHKDCVNVLLNNGAAVNLCDLNEDSPLFVASVNGYNGCVDILIKRGAEVNKYNKCGYSPLSATILNMSFDNELVKSCKINGLNSELYARYKDCVKLLLGNGATVNQCDVIGTPPLTSILCFGKVDTLYMTIKKEPNVNMWTEDEILSFIKMTRGLNDWIDMLLKVIDITQVNEDWLKKLAVPQDNSTILEMIDILCYFGADIDLCNQLGESPLYIASFLGQIDCVNLLLKKGADVNLCGVNGTSPIFAALERSNTDILEILCNNGALVNRCHKDGTSPLCKAIRQGHKDCINMLLNKGANINLSDGKGEFPLIAALVQGKADIVEMLCNRGADVNLLCNNGASPLFLTSCAGYKDCVNMLLNKGADVNLCDVNGQSPLIAAVVQGKADIVEMLCNRGADVNLRCNDGASPLYKASCAGHTGCVNTLLNKGAEVNLCDVNGQSPLLAAVVQGKADIVEMLCNRGADVNLRCNDGASPLYIASCAGYKDCVNMLLNKGADVNLCELNGLSPLFGALVQGEADILEMLCNREANVNLRCNNGASALYIASSAGHTGCVNMLLNKGAEVNLCDVNGLSPLIAAVVQDKADVVEMLCNRGADVNLCQQDGMSPLYLASHQGNKELVNLLLKKDAKINLYDVKRQSPLFTASAEGHTDIVEILCSRKADVNLCRYDKLSPLNVASSGGHKDCVNVLLNKGAIVNLCNVNRESPLFLASFGGKEHILEILCNRGAQVNLCRKDGATPLYIASSQGHKDCVKVLLRNGANVNQCDINGASPLFAAAVSGNSKILKKLSKILDLCVKYRKSINFKASFQKRLKWWYYLSMYSSFEKYECKSMRLDKVKKKYLSVLEHKDCVSVLLNNGADVNLCNSFGRSPLFAASFVGNTDVIKTLCNRGADVNLCDKDGVSPLYIASSQGHTMCVELLLNKGAAVNLHDVNIISPLFVASYHGTTDIVKMLCQRGADVNLCRKDGASPLYIASCKGHEYCVDELLNKEAKLNQCDVYGQSPIFAASAEGKKEIVELLYNKGADVNLCRKDGASPLCIALSRGNYNIVAFFKENLKRKFMLIFLLFNLIMFAACGGRI